MLLVSVGGLCVHMISRDEIHYFSQWSLVDSSFGMSGLLWVTWIKTCSMTCSSSVVFIFKLLSYLQLKLFDCWIGLLHSWSHLQSMVQLTPQLNYQRRNLTFTLHKTNIAPENRVSPRKLVFQPSIFRWYVSFREGNLLTSMPIQRCKHRFCIDIKVIPLVW